MATLVSTKPLLLKPFPLPTNPNPNSISARTPSRTFSLSIDKAPRSGLTVHCTGNNYGDFERENVIYPRSDENEWSKERETIMYPKPEVIEWSKDLTNSVRLIGTVGQPIQMKPLSSGKAVAWTKLGVWKSPTDTTWVNLTFWEEMAYIAYQHVEAGQRIFVSGKLVSDIVTSEDESVQTYFKVVVYDIKFVGKRLLPVSTFEPRPNQISTGSVEELWQAFFANPVDWWDNRLNKRNPNYPDFKHKDTGESLWINGKYNPSWVKSQLEILDSKMASMQEANSRESNKVSFSDLTLQ